MGITGVQQGLMEGWCGEFYSGREALEENHRENVVYELLFDVSFLFVVVFLTHLIMLPIESPTLGKYKSVLLATKTGCTRAVFWNFSCVHVFLPFVCLILLPFSPERMILFTLHLLLCWNWTQLAGEANDKQISHSCQLLVFWDFYAHKLTPLRWTAVPKHQVTSESSLRPKTRIICTIGPRTNTVEKLEQLLDAGMCCVRLNTAHGDFDVRTFTFDPLFC